MQHALEVYQQKELIFYSDKNWLYPLFDLEKHLLKNDFDPAQLFLRDKIVGRAAALLFVHLGLKKVRCGILSQRGKEILEHYKVEFSFEELVPRIKCKTEELLINEFNPTAAYKLLKQRAKL